MNRPDEDADRVGNANPNACRLRNTWMVYKACLAYTILTTLVWVYFVVTGNDGGVFFGGYEVNFQKILEVAGGIVFFWMIWSYAFHWLKWWLLRRAGMSQQELQLVFGSRLEGFKLEEILARHPERTIRIIDMIGRRSRTILLVLAGFAAVYIQIGKNPTPESLQMGLQTGMFDALITSWFTLLAFTSNGPMGHMVYGAHSRVLDGIQGRANALCIATLWNLFKFILIPVGVKLGKIYPPETFAVLYAFIWLTYATADFSSEIFGSIFGRHRIRVWGLGDMNRKSWAGVVAALLATLTLNLYIVTSNGLGPSWYGLAILLALVNPFIELYSPRGTDDFTMATTNALICWGFGLLFF